MLKYNPWFNYYRALDTELMQSEDEGRDVSSFRQLVEKIDVSDSFTFEGDQKIGDLLDQIQQLPVSPGYRYNEPSDLDGIHSLQTVKEDNSAPDSEKLYDKIYGAWLGRIAGCLLGKPVEGWSRSAIEKLAKAGDNYPLTYYISSDVPSPCYEGYFTPENAKIAPFINNIKDFAPEDDDTNYTVIGLNILKIYGKDFTSMDVAESWLANIPPLHVCTAEFAAFRNIMNRIYPPVSASYRNPYREWIGAQIRADIFGYVNPGDPKAAADMAYRDASMTHVKNGIYGEMYVAAMLAKASVTDDINEVINAGLACIPHTSRLYESIKMLMSWKESGLDYIGATDKLHKIYSETVHHDSVHTISNAMIVTLALIYGEKDYAKTVSIAVMAGLDTDCNGATAGSIMGMLLGANALPQNWIQPLNDTLKTGIDGYNTVKISDLAKDTWQFIQK